MLAQELVQHRGHLFYLLEQNDAQQQKEAQEPVIVGNDNSNLVTIESVENKDDNHHIRNFIIGTACGIVVGIVAYKISHDIIMPHVIAPEATDQKTSFYGIKVFIRDKEGEVAHEIQVPDDFMLDNSLEKRADFFKWIKETYKNSYECKYTEFTKKDGFLSGKSTNLVINPHNK